MQQVEHQVVEDFMIVGMEEDNADEVSFTVFGKPPIQNGWKLAWKQMGRRPPVIYDAKKGEKAMLRNLLKAAIRGFGRYQCPLFRKQTLSVSVVFGLRDIASKDVDNLSKFLLDAMEGAIFDDDKFVYSLHASKVAVTTLEAKEFTSVQVTMA